MSALRNWKERNAAHIHDQEWDMRASGGEYNRQKSQSSSKPSPVQPSGMKYSQRSLLHKNGYTLQSNGMLKDVDGKIVSVECAMKRIADKAAVELLYGTAVGI